MKYTKTVINNWNNCEGGTQIGHLGSLNINIEKSGSGVQMPVEHFEFIDKLKYYFLEATNMTENDAWRTAFIIWQNRDFLQRYLRGDEE